MRALVQVAIGCLVSGGLYLAALAGSSVEGLVFKLAGLEINLDSYGFVEPMLGTIFAVSLILLFRSAVLLIADTRERHWSRLASTAPSAGTTADYRRDEARRASRANAAAGLWSAVKRFAQIAAVLGVVALTALFLISLAPPNGSGKGQLDKPKALGQI
ncbi:MAG: hypothetical protein ACKVOP_07705 [Sphingomonadaceae bacterium]